MATALLTDLYELTMAASYLRRGMTGEAVFSLFVRRLPPRRGFLVAVGIESCLSHLESLRFEAADLAYLAQHGFRDDDLAAFEGLRFTGEVRAVEEGTVVFAEEPLLEVRAPLPEAQLVETLLLNQVTFPSAIASKAARCRLAAAGKVDLIEFGFRRTHGLDAGVAAARSAALVGFSATSNVEASRRFGIPPAGTMAHSYIEAFESELEAFRAYGRDFPDSATFLVDTYDTLAGVRNAITVIKELGLETRAAVRLDSGDLDRLSRQSRELLDGAGLDRVHIFVSGSLDEDRLGVLVAAGAPIDAAGLGTRLSTAADAPYLESVYKLVSYGGRPVAKLSAGKSTSPGAKQIFRDWRGGDRIGLASEPTPRGAEALLGVVMEAGRRVRPAPTPETALHAARVRFERDLSALPPMALELEDPAPLICSMTDDLRELTDRVQGHLRAGAPSPEDV